MLYSPAYVCFVDGQKCLQFWYYVRGSAVAAINVFKREVREHLNANETLLAAKPLWSLTASGDEGDEWHVVQVSFLPPAKTRFHIAFESVVVGASGEAATAIDDYEIKEHACQPLGNCDFEHDMCAWKNAERGANIQWTRHRGTTTTTAAAAVDNSQQSQRRLGPSVDHTLGTQYGTYIFFPTDVNTKMYDTARLVSPVFATNMSSSSFEQLSAALPSASSFDDASLMCFEFYYHMQGKHESVLNVRRKTFAAAAAAAAAGAASGNDSEGKIVWSDSKEYGDEWRYASVTIDLSSGSGSGSDALVTSRPVVLVLEAVSQAYGEGDIALDDLRVHHNTGCSMLNEQLHAFTCSNGVKLPESKVCNFVADCPNAEEEHACGYDHVTFESDHGKWTQPSVNAEGVLDTRFVWARGFFGEGVRGPSVDHTTYTTSGRYLYLHPNVNAAAVAVQAEQSERTAGVFQSPTMRDSAPLCDMKFWYQMKGQQHGRGFIHVFTQVAAQRARILRLVDDTGTTQGWVQATAHIARLRSAFTVSVEGVLNVNNHTSDASYIAIDDIQFFSKRTRTSLQNNT